MRKLNRIFLFLAIFCTPLFEAYARPTQQQVFSSIVEHINTVKKNGVAIIANHPQHFPALHSLSPEFRFQFINFYLGMHDLLKVELDLEKLRELGYKGETTFFEKIHLNWGRDRAPKFVKEMNRMESDFIDRNMRKHFGLMEPNLFTQCIQEVSYAEFIVDQTDAKISRGVELGINPKPFDAEARFSDIYNDKLGAQLSRWVETVLYPRQNLIMCESHFISTGK